MNEARARVVPPPGPRSIIRQRDYRAFFVFCDSALPAADFVALLVRPSRSADDAFVAVRFVVVRLGALRCASALPAADFDFVAVAPLRSVFDALVAAFLPVSLPMRYLGV